jgi:hypothetical protein
MAGPTPAATGRIFISYRREETAYPAGWLFDRLADRFGGSQVFKDVDSIQLGDDFERRRAQPPAQIQQRLLRRRGTSRPASPAVSLPRTRRGQTVPGQPICQNACAPRGCGSCGVATGRSPGGTTHRAGCPMIFAQLASSGWVVLRRGHGPHEPLSRVPDKYQAGDTRHDGRRP